MLLWVLCRRGWTAGTQPVYVQQDLRALGLGYVLDNGHPIIRIALLVVLDKDGISRMDDESSIYVEVSSLWLGVQSALWKKKIATYIQWLFP